MAEQTGSCLCGAVTLRADLDGEAGACHCSMCRAWAGGPYMVVHGKLIAIEGEEAVGVYRSSDWAERGFCKQCGSSLFYHLFPNQKFPDGEHILSAGLFKDQSGFTFKNEVFVDGNPGWYRFADEETRERMTEADIFAKYAPKDGEA